MADYFLKVDGMPGESVDAKHKGEIDVLAFSWGVSRTSDPAVGAGAGSGKAVFDDLLVVARTSMASPLLWLACAAGTHIKTAVLTCRRSGKTAVEFLTITMSDVVVASYELDSSDDGPPLDQIGLAYAKIETQYAPVDATGKAQAPVKAGWDLASGKKV